MVYVIMSHQHLNENLSYDKEAATFYFVTAWMCVCVCMYASITTKVID